MPWVDHGSSTPSLMVAAGSPTTSSGSTAIFVPRPVQVGHAPKGALNEKVLGSISLRTISCSFGQLRRSLKVRVFFSSTKSTITLPSASLSAVSTLSVILPWASAFTTSRSTTTEISCLKLFFRGFASVRVTVSPSTTARAYPCDCKEAKRSANSPFFCWTIGARSWKRVPSLMVMSWSTIACGVCFEMTSPHSWQWGTPILAHKSLR